MLKLIVRAAIPLLAATAMAQAADSMPTGRITYIDRQGGQILINNVETYRPDASILAGLNVGDGFMLPANADLAMSGPQKAGMSARIEQTAHGQLTWMDSGASKMIVGNVMLSMPSSFDMAKVHLGQTLDVTYVSSGAINAAKEIAWAGQPKMTIAAADQSTAGHVTFIDHAAGMILVNNAQLRVPAGMDITTLRIGDLVQASFTTTASGNIATGIASLG